ncbi:hypothetical protein J437_LFUL008684 [Ladona fulva]|uniref:THAP-type domain-containing protein n=1 Tax=Ladona fulva TaxID=123851 RepID=A0A8K0NY29_LADFU|nr:hypothetical protein J437_LFUL008684 [Ladona fulva]
MVMGIGSASSTMTNDVSYKCADWVSCKNPALERKIASGKKLRKTHNRVCAVHFEDHCFRTPHKDKIFRGVLPTLYPPSPQDTINRNTETTSSSTPTPSPGPSFTLSPIPPHSPTTSSLLPRFSFPSPSKFPQLSTPIPSPGPSFTPLPIPPQSPTTSYLPSPLPSYSFPLPSKTPPHLHLSDIGYKRIVHCSPQKKILFRYARSQERKVRNLMIRCRKLKQKLKGMGDFLSEGGRDITKELPPSAIMFINAHLRSYKRQPKGRRWTVEEKRMALTIHKRCPKCYRLLCNMFVLPSPRTLSSMLNSVPFSTGINDQIKFLMQL